MAVLVGKAAPFFHDTNKTFTAVAGDGKILEDFNFSKATTGQYTVLFFYPLDFTFVCPSELIAFHNRFQAFQARNTTVISVSLDSHFTHAAWRHTPVEKGGVGALGYTMVSDIKREIIQAYDVESHNGVALRGSFLIDQAGIVQHQVINNLPLGRNVDEMLRMIDALQFSEKHGEVCPAGWQKGQDGMRPNAEGVASYLAQHAKSL